MGLQAVAALLSAISVILVILKIETSQRLLYLNIERCFGLWPFAIGIFLKAEFDSYERTLRLMTQIVLSIPSTAWRTDHDSKTRVTSSSATIEKFENCMTAVLTMA